MFDVSIFPTADVVRNSTKEDFESYIFEKEVEKLFELIVWGIDMKFKDIYVTDLSDAAMNFLIDKGYKVERALDSWRIKWGE